MIYYLSKTIILAILFASGASAKLKLDSCTDLDHGRYTHFDSGHFAICEQDKVVCYKNLVSDKYSDSPTEKVDCSTIDGKKVKRNLGVYSKGNPWPKGVMCYKITGQFSSEERGHIEKAAADINAATSQTGASALPVDKCKPGDGVCGGCRNYVDVQSQAQGCFSLIGYSGQVQKLNLQPGGCFNKQEGTPLHEFGHALGLFHEHSHPKRGVIVIENHLKVPPSNYAVQKDAGTTPYDKDSIMHYPAYDGRQKTGLCVPLAKYKDTKFCGIEEQRGANGCVEATEQHCDTNAGQSIGKTKKLSAGDIATLKAIYKGGSGGGETEKTTDTPTKPGPDTGSGTGPKIEPRIRPGTPGRPGQPRPSMPGQPRPSMPGTPGRPGQPRPSMPETPGRPGQPRTSMPGQPRPSMPGTPGRPGQPRPSMPGQPRPSMPEMRTPQPETGTEKKTRKCSPRRLRAAN